MGSSGFRRMFGWLRGDDARQVDVELRAHIEMKQQDLIDTGVDPDTAERRARESFGDVEGIGEECRRIQAELHQRRGLADAFDSLAQDVRFAVRGLRRSPGFSAVAILTLALGIGANTAIFGVVNGILLRTLPAIDAPHRLVEITQGDGDDFASLSYPVFDYVRRTSSTLDDLAAFDVVSMAFGSGDSPQVFFGLQVTGNYFDVLGVPPAAGRFFDPRRSFHPTVEDAVVISHSLWQRAFAGAEDVVGRDVVLNGYPATIIGVAAPGFGGHLVAVQADVFVLLGMPAPQVHSAESLDATGNNMLETVGRMREGVDVAAVREEVAALAGDFIRDEQGPEAEYPLQTAAYGAVPGSARSVATLFFGVLMAILGLLLLITCVNVANMMLSRASERRREIAVRLSLGARRGRLVRQMLTESVVLASVAAAIGALLAMWLTGVLMSFQPPVVPFPGMRLAFDFGLDLRVLGFTTLLVGVATAAFGLVPALRATRPELVGALKDGAGNVGLRRSRLRGALVGLQMAVTVLLLLGSGLFLRALQSAQTIETGFDTTDVYVAGFDLELNGYDDFGTEGFYTQLMERAATIPDVDTVAIAGKLPLAGASSTSIRIPGVETGGFQVDDGLPLFSLHNQSVSAGYFDTLDIELLRGDIFRDSDTAEAPTVAVINRTMAERFWSLDTATGQRFQLFGNDVAIIGVVEDARYHSLVEDTPLFAYFDYRQRPRTDMYLHLGTSGVDEALLWSAMREVSADVDASVPMVNNASLSSALEIFFLPQIVAAWVTGVAGAFGLLLGVVGIYGVTAHAASRRSHEIGVRIALGAGTAEVRSMMLRQGLWAPAVGMVIGLVGALAVTRLLGALLVGVSPLDPIAFFGVVGLLGGAAVVAALVPARRAAVVDPIVTLKAD